MAKATVIEPAKGKAVTYDFAGGKKSREDALKKLENPAYDPATIEDEYKYISTKLQISNEELKGYFTMPKKFYWDYKNQENIFKIGAKVLKFLGIEKSIKR